MFFKSQEAMHALGVPTTRSVALVASKSERVLRAWYKNASSAISAGTHNPDEFISGDHMEEVRERTFREPSRQSCRLLSQSRRPCFPPSANRTFCRPVPSPARVLPPYTLPPTCPSANLTRCRPFLSTCTSANLTLGAPFLVGHVSHRQLFSDICLPTRLPFLSLACRFGHTLFFFRSRARSPRAPRARSSASASLSSTAAERGMAIRPRSVSSRCLRATRSRGNTPSR